MNKQKLFVGITLALLLIGIIGTIPSVEAQTKNVFKPYWEKVTSLIRANSCDADNVCEVRNLRVTGATISGADRIIADSGYFTDFLRVVSGEPANIAGAVLEVDNIEVNGGSVTGASQITGIKGTFTASLKVSSKGGNGNAFACFDKHGILFRSQEPCV